jgi:3-oxoacyl-[acyl-carrier-protein] synthase-1/3-oxoacyl-[acyl-carrier-protein] synthase II
MSAIIAWGASSALGTGDAAIAVPPIGHSAPVRVREDEELALAGLKRPYAARAAGVLDREVDRATALLSLALADCARELDVVRPDWRTLRVGAAIGTSSGGMRAFEQGARIWSPYIDPLLDAPRPCAFEPCSLVLGACASSAIAIGLGRAWLESGRCDVVLCGGFDAVSVFVAAGFECLRATSSGKGPRPFRTDRDGLVLGEGAAIVALVSHAQAARSARARAWIHGFGCTCDARHLTAPDAEGGGLARAAEAALASAGTTAASIGLVSAHGTATRQNDDAEAAAVVQVLGASSRVPVFAFKGTIGHTLGAAGALEVLASIAAMEQGIAPASVGEAAAEPGITVLDRSEPLVARTTLKLSAAFGGANAALVVGLDRPKAEIVSGDDVFVTPAVTLTVEDADAARLAARTGYGSDRIARADDLVRLAIGAVAALQDEVGSLRGAGIIVGHGLATIATNRRFLDRLQRAGAARGEPRCFPYTTPNAAAGECAVAFGLTGPAFAVGGGSHGGIEALGVAADLVRTRVAKRIVVVVVDAPADGEGAAVALVVGDRDLQGAIGRIEEHTTRVEIGASSSGPKDEGAHRALLPLVGRREGELVLSSSGPVGARARIRYLGAPG